MHTPAGSLWGHIFFLGVNKIKGGRRPAFRNTDNSHREHWELLVVCIPLYDILQEFISVYKKQQREMPQSRQFQAFVRISYSTNPYTKYEVIQTQYIQIIWTPNTMHNDFYSVYRHEMCTLSVDTSICYIFSVGNKMQSAHTTVSRKPRGVPQE